MNIYDDLEKLKKLLDEEAITQEEYEREKERIFSSGSFSKANGWDLGIDEKSFAVLMHGVTVSDKLRHSVDNVAYVS